MTEDRRRFLKFSLRRRQGHDPGVSCAASDSRIVPAPRDQVRARSIALAPDREKEHSGSGAVPDAGSNHPVYPRL